MTTRPALGTRVRVLGNTGIPGIAGREGEVDSYHEDGIASIVRLDFDRAAWLEGDRITGEYFVLDPCDLESAETVNG